MSESDDLIWHFEAANQEGGEQPVIPASQLPKVHLDYTDSPGGKQFLDHLLSPGTIGNPDAPAFEHQPVRGWDSDYLPKLHDRLRRKRERNIQRDLDDNDPNTPEKPEGWRTFHVTKDSTPEEIHGAADSIARLLDQGDDEEREIEHGLPERMTGAHGENAGSAQTAHPVRRPSSDMEGFLRDRWHLSVFPSMEPMPPGTLRPSRRWVRRAWETKVGPLACEHPGCPPWEHREPRTAELTGHFEAAAEPELEYHYLLQGAKMAHPFQAVIAAHDGTVVGHLSGGQGLLMSVSSGCTRITAARASRPRCGTTVRRSASRPSTTVTAPMRAMPGRARSPRISPPGRTTPLRMTRRRSAGVSSQPIR